jgi:hypothetical protein
VGLAKLYIKTWTRYNLEMKNENSIIYKVKLNNRGKHDMRKGSSGNQRR